MEQQRLNDVSDVDDEIGKDLQQLFSELEDRSLFFREVGHEDLFYVGVVFGREKQVAQKIEKIVNGLMAQSLTELARIRENDQDLDERMAGFPQFLHPPNLLFLQKYLANDAK